MGDSANSSAGRRRESKIKGTRLEAQPLYKRAELEMVNRIANKTWMPGQQLPNEFVLAEEFNVSQGTIRKALSSMEKRGLLARHPGRGTSVSRTTPEEALFAFFRLRDGEGNIVVPDTLKEDILRRQATERERKILSPAATEVYELRRVRHNGGRPFAMEVMSFSASLCKGMENDLPLPSSLYPYLSERFGITIMSASESVAAAVADEEIARLFSIEVGAPLLKVSRKAHDLADRVVELRESYYLTEFATYQVELNRGDGL